MSWVTISIDPCTLGIKNPSGYFHKQPDGNEKHLKRIIVSYLVSARFNLDIAPLNVSS